MDRKVPIQHGLLYRGRVIANDPDIEIDDLPKTFIDATTKSGMSGSPVIIEDNFRIERILYGIYSGRIGQDFFKPDISETTDTSAKAIEDKIFQAQLGIAWKARAIDEIIEGKIKGQNSESFMPL